MIAVTGATGQLGELVIQELIKKVKPSEVIALVRDPAKADSIAKQGVQVRKADYDQPQSWEAALKGVTKLLLISSNAVGARAAQHKTVIEAAKRAGVLLIAYTSSLHADKSKLSLANEHRQTEADLRQSGVGYVLLRNGWYSENYTAGLKGALEHGVIFGAAGSGRISSAPRADYALAAATVLTSKENQAGIAGDSSYTLQDLASETSKAAGKKIEFRNLSKADYKAMLVKIGLPESISELFADSDAAAANGALFDEGRALSQLIGRPTTPISATVKQSI
jgi:NAD(P)H dehydrogenase (quinone)